MKIGRKRCKMMKRWRMKIWRKRGIRVRRWRRVKMTRRGELLIEIFNFSLA